MYPRGLPGDPRITILLGLLFVALFIYVVINGDTFGYVVFGVLAVFILLPAIVLLALNRGRLPRLPRQPDTSTDTSTGEDADPAARHNDNSQ
jgi:hypothetical protein